MANEVSNNTFSGLTQEQSDLFDKLIQLYKEQDALWEKLTKNAKDTDGDGTPDIDKTSADYKEYQKLADKLDALWKEVDALDTKIVAAESDIQATSIAIDVNVIEGTDGDDDLTGTDKYDDIQGKAGNDKLSGGDEFDFLNGGEGNDTLSGDAGDDNLMGGDGNDVLNGGEGTDFLNGGSGNDTMAGGQGGDYFSLDGNSGHDEITDFNVKEDRIDLWAEGIKFEDLKSEKTSDGLKVSWGENSVLLKGVTADLSEDWFNVGGGIIIEPLPIEPGEVLEGTDGDDTLTGGEGWDYLNGGKGNDVLDGGQESDNLTGGEGNDILKGGDGFDYLDGGTGNDTMTGGTGGDQYFFNDDSGQDEITDFNPEEDTISLFAEGVEFKDLKSEKTNEGLKVSWGENSVLLKGVTADLSEKWFFANGGFIIEPIPVEPGVFLDGTDGDDDLKGGDGWDYLNGGKGNDTLSGGKEGDSLYGDEGNDVLNGGDGFDYLDGGAGNDTMTGGTGGDHYSFGDTSGNDEITDFNPEEDSISVYADGVKFEDLKSEKTSDGLKVSWGDNSVLLKGVTADLDEKWFYASGGIIIEPIEPGKGINTVRGTDGADTLTGGDGYDDLFGGAGNDSLSGGKDIDYLFGEEGDDTLTGGEDGDVFHFAENSGKDVITDFKPGEDSIDLSGAGVEFKDLTSKQENGGTLISWGDNSIFLQGVTDTVEESWFMIAIDLPSDAVTFSS